MLFFIVALLPLVFGYINKPCGPNGVTVCEKTGYITLTTNLKAVIADCVYINCYALSFYGPGVDLTFRNVSFIGYYNVKNYNGGLMFFQAGAKASFDNLVIKGTQFNYYFGAIAVWKSSITISNAHFEDNISATWEVSRNINLMEGAYLVCRNCTFMGSDRILEFPNGLAISSEVIDGHLDCFQCHFYHTLLAVQCWSGIDRNFTKVNLQGGSFIFRNLNGFSAYCGHSVINGVQFEGFNSTMNAMTTDGATLDVMNSKIGGIGKYNSGLRISNFASAIITNCTFESISSTHVESGGMVTFRSSIIRHRNVLNYLYSPMYAESGSIIIIEDGTIVESDSTARSSVGKVRYGSSFVCRGSSRIRSNQAYKGGAIWASSESQIHLSGCLITNNKAMTYGGAVFLEDSDLYIDGNETQFVGNEAKMDGGAIYANLQSRIIVNGQVGFYNNSARLLGGAIAALDSSIEAGDGSNDVAIHGIGNSAWRGSLLSVLGTLSRFDHQHIRPNLSKEHGIYVQDIQTALHFIGQYGDDWRELIWTGTAMDLVISSSRNEISNNSTISLHLSERIPAFAGSPIDAFGMFPRIDPKYPIIVWAEETNHGAEMDGQLTQTIISAESQLNFVDLAVRNPTPQVPYRVRLRVLKNPSFPQLPPSLEWPSFTVIYRDCGDDVYISKLSRCIKRADVSRVSRGGLAFASVVLVVFGLLSARLLWVFREAGHVKRNSFLFLFLINGGVLLGFLSVTTTFQVSSSTCMIPVILENIGLFTCLAAMIIKTYRIDRIFSQNALSSKHGKELGQSLRDQKLIIWFACILAAVCAYLVSWSLLDPSHFELDASAVMVEDGVQTDRCSNGQFGVILSLLKFLTLLLLAVYTYRIRNVPDEYNEAVSMGWTTYSWLVFGGFSTVLTEFVGLHGTLGYLISGVSLMTANLVTLHLMVLSKLYRCIFITSSPGNQDKDAGPKSTTLLSLPQTKN